MPRDAPGDESPLLRALPNLVAADLSMTKIRVSPELRSALARIDRLHVAVSHSGACACHSEPTCTELWRPRYWQPHDGGPTLAGMPAEPVVYNPFA